MKTTTNGEWKRLDTPEGFPGMSSHAICKTGSGSGDAVVIVGGEDGPRTLLKDAMWIYSDGEISRKKSDVLLLGHSCVLTSAGAVLFGGRQGGTLGEGEEANSVWSWSDGMWKPLEPANEDDAIPSTRAYHASAGVGGFLYVFGGCSGHSRVNDLWCFDVEKRAWTQLHAGGEDAPSSRGGASLWARSANELFLLFGFQPTHPTGPELDDVWRFEMSSASWRRVERAGGQPWPAPRSVAGLAALEGRCLIFGGESAPSDHGHEGAGSFHADAWTFDGTAFARVEAEDPPRARGWHGMCALDGESALVVGGLDAANQRLSDAHILQLL